MAKAKKLPSGNWRVQASKMIDGKLVRRSFTDSDRKKALRAANNWLNEIADSFIDFEDITLAEAYSRYIKSKSKVLSPNSVREYKRHSKNYLQSIMPLRLKSLTNEKIQTAINLDAVGKSAKTVHDIAGLLSGVLKMFYPGFNLRLTLPKKEKPSLYIPTENEIKTLIAAVKDTDMELPILLAAFGPMRRGEICALTSADINGCTVTINKAMAQDDDKEWVIKPPKTTAGYRTIIYPEFMRPLLQAVNSGKVYDKTPSSLTARFPHILKKCGLPSFRFHDLRHYCVSFLHSQNVPTKYIMARGGWESESIVNNIYNHILTDKDTEINDKINAAFLNTFSGENQTTAHEIAHAEKNTA